VISRASAIVVAGGKSSRLGQDKRLLRLFSSRTLLEETILRVSTLTDDVVVVVSSQSVDLEGLPSKIVRDPVPGAGPLNALYAGLMAAEHEYAIVVACDMPFLSTALLQGLLELPRGYDALVPRRSDGTLETLHAVYRKTCLEAIRRRLDAGRLKLAALLDDVTVRFVDEPWLRQYDPQLRSLLNVNTPEDLENVKDLA
jgi:molybdopterin-guanine dinucleotide biosynthesis protein A